MGTTFDIFCRNGELHIQREACRRKIEYKILQKSVSLFSRLLLWGFAKTSRYGFLYGTKHSLVYNQIVYHHHYSFLGDFKVRCCALVNITTSSSVLQLRLLQMRNSALSLESKYQQFYQTKYYASIPKIKLKQSCRRHLPPSNISMQNSAKLISFACPEDSPQELFKLTVHAVC